MWSGTSGAPAKVSTLLSTAYDFLVFNHLRLRLNLTTGFLQMLCFQISSSGWTRSAAPSPSTPRSRTWSTTRGRGLTVSSTTASPPQLLPPQPPRSCSSPARAPAPRSPPRTPSDSPQTPSLFSRGDSPSPPHNHEATLSHTFWPPRAI